MLDLDLLDIFIQFWSVENEYSWLVDKSLDF